MNCNNNCKWCYAQKYICFNKIMSFSKISEYVLQFRKNGVKKIILIGGEPSIHPDILKIIKFISENKMEVAMATNGRKFSDIEFTKLAKKYGLKNVNISLKGSSEDEYLRNTNNKGFTEAMEGYKNLQKCNINTTISYVLCDKNYDTFDNFWNLVKKENLNNILFQLYKPSAEDKTYPISIFELADLCKYVYDKIYKEDKNFVFEMSIPLCVLDENMLNHMILKNRIITCCHISKGTGLVFDSDFNIIPCNHFMGHPLNESVLNSNEILKFWNCLRAKEFRKIIARYPSEVCSRCRKWYQCGGGCSIRWLSMDPTKIINDKYVYDKEVTK